MKKSAKMFAMKTRREKRKNEKEKERRKQDKIQRKFDYVRSHKIIARLSDCAMKEDGKVYSCQIYKSSNDSIDTQWEPLVTFIKYIYMNI